MALILPITTGFVFSQYTKNTKDMQVRYSAKDLPEHGIIIILPTDAEFDVLAGTLLAKQNDPDFEKIKPFSIFLKNSSSKAVVAHSIVWKFVDATGKIADFKINYVDSPALTDGILNVESDEQTNETIPAGGYRFLTLAPKLNSQGGGGSELSHEKNVLDTTQESSIEEKRGKAIESLYSRVLKNNNEVIILLDGAFFDDGLYVGSDTTNFFNVVDAHVRATREVISSISKILGNSAQEDTILKTLQEKGESKLKKSRDLSNPEEQYDDSTRIVATYLSKLKQIFGEKGLKDEINSFSKRSLPKIRKFKEGDYHDKIIERKKTL